MIPKELQEVFSFENASAVKRTTVSSLPHSGIILILAAASLVAAAVIAPSFGRVFLPEFQEQTLVNTLTLYPGVSLETTNVAGEAIQDALLKTVKATHITKFPLYYTLKTIVIGDTFKWGEVWKILMVIWML